ncbi:MAG: chemotaxis protein, partial [Akkermansiaceae bacterium]|nr:chemotaxis protein [Akkermansiaceae bacterium]
MTGSKSAPHGFPVVGIGASAGGVSALKSFFEKAPVDGGLAYVVIMHLSKDHESVLAQILQTSTRMPVRQVNEPLTVEPDHVYVIPPDRNLAMIDGIISLTARAEAPGKRIPIDLFFRTLADAYGKDAYAVVLSGTGKDGTMGIERVKEVGGVTLVQSPEDAEFDGMPLSAIATHLIDIVLPAAELPAKIVSIHEFDRKTSHPGLPSSTDITEDEQEAASLREILG